MNRKLRKILSGLSTVGLVMAGSVTLMSGAAKKGGKRNEEKAEIVRRKPVNDLKGKAGTVEDKAAKKSTPEKQAPKTSTKSK